MKQKLLLVFFPVVLIALAVFYVIPAVERSGYDFTLKSASGDVHLSDFRGKAVAVYFGYTFCPDICPTSLSTMAEAMKQLSPEEAGSMQVIFISVDPGRDTPEGLKEYVEYFHPSFIGATADKNTIDSIVSQYDGTTYTIIQGGSEAMGYTVGHTSFVYFFDAKGDYVSRLNHSIDPSETAKHMREAIHSDKAI